MSAYVRLLLPAFFFTFCHIFSHTNLTNHRDLSPNSMQMPIPYLMWFLDSYPLWYHFVLYLSIFQSQLHSVTFILYLEYTNIFLTSQSLWLIILSAWNHLSFFSLYDQCLAQMSNCPVSLFFTTLSKSHLFPHSILSNSEYLLISKIILLICWLASCHLWRGREVFASREIVVNLNVNLPGLSHSISTISWTN